MHLDSCGPCSQPFSGSRWVSSCGGRSGGALTLTLILTVFFVIEGLTSIMYALEHKRELSGRWGWMLARGVVDLILACIIFLGLPGTAA